ncbi:MAG TPA: glycoside hydrolase family 31 protein [Fervidobacterium sp.]|nr:glycoside hydrolase family 31 protein [Fervidobacterium sp.]
MFTKFEVSNLTSLYRSGKPFATGAVTATIDESKFQQVSTLPHFDVEETEDSVIFTHKMAKDDVVYGLGESMGSLNKRGRIYRMYSTDDPEHTPDKKSLYGSHPFLIIDGASTFGLLVDYPSEIIFDVGFTDKDILKITIPSHNFDFYIFETDDKQKIVAEYLQLTGKPYIPPKWAFGFQQSRWSYFSEREIRDVASKFRELSIPCDVIYTDIDYMERYKVFTTDKTRFPDYASMVKDLAQEGIKIVPIVDPGVRIEEGYPVYEEGKKNGYFCKDKDGKDYVAAVWPGLTHFPDFLNSNVRTWWGEKYKFFTDMGIRGIWNDMNEPAVFYTLDGVNRVVKAIEEFEKSDEEDKLDAVLKVRDAASNMAVKREDYKSFYHRLDDGTIVNHDDVHNLYGFYMTKAAADSLSKLLPGERYLLLSRSSYPGLHRMGTIWMGDNKSWWEHMLANIRMLQSLNMMGFFYTGADVGGFGGDTSPELLIRWMELGAFTPYFRNHSALGTRPQELWQFDEETLNITRDIVRLRYAFLPYTYSEFMNAVKTSTPFVMPLSFVFEDERTKDIEDQYMYGSSLMVAPVHEQNKKGRYVYLPETKWLNWTASKYEDREMKVYEPGDHYIKAELHEIPLFIKQNGMIVLTEPMNYVGERDVTEITVVGFITDHAHYDYYDDDGTSLNYLKGEYANISIDIAKEGKGFKINLKKNDPNDILKIKKIRFEIYDDQGNIQISSRTI